MAQDEGQSHSTSSLPSRGSRHELHNCLFAIDVAVANLVLLDDGAARSELGSAVRKELERAHEIVRRVMPPDESADAPPRDGSPARGE